MDGAGKTVLYRKIIHYLRSKNKIVLIGSVSGIASLLLPGSRAMHSRFLLQVPLPLEGVKANIAANNGLAPTAAALAWSFGMKLPTHLALQSTQSTTAWKTCCNTRIGSINICLWGLANALRWWLSPDPTNATPRGHPRMACADTKNLRLVGCRQTSQKLQTGEE